MNENEQMRVLAQQLWKNYMEPQVEKKLALTVRYFRAQVVSNPGNNTLEVQRAGDANAMTLPCTNVMSDAAAGDQCVVFVFGNLSNAVVVTDGTFSSLDKNEFTDQDVILLNAVVQRILDFGPLITEQPQNASAANGANVSVKVVAVGTGLTYQWWYKNAGQSSFSQSSTTTSTYTVQMNSTRNGRQLYCVVTDSNGNSVNSDIATISMT